MNVPSTNYKAWLAKAENDLINIKNNLEGEIIPWDTVCFHAQQAAEKVLKAFLVYHKEVPERTHDLLRLLKECQRLDGSLTELSLQCELLTPQGVGTRYPDDYTTVDVPDESEGRTMIEAAYRIRNRILELLP